MVKAAVFVCESIFSFNTPDLEKHNHVIFETSGKNILLTETDSFMHFPKNLSSVQREGISVTTKCMKIKE